MSQPEFISLEAVLILHDISITRFGGDSGIRDKGLVESALASAVNTHLYAQGDLFDIAATYAFHLAENQPFIDGNKRTALMAALAFLEINGVTKRFDQEKLYNSIIGFSSKTVSKMDFADFLRKAASSA